MKTLSNCLIILFKLLLNNKNRIKLLICRFILLSLGIYYALYLSCVSRDHTKLALLVFSLLIIVDTLYVCIKRNGIDFDW